MILASRQYERRESLPPPSHRRLNRGAVSRGVPSTFNESRDALMPPRLIRLTLLPAISNTTRKRTSRNERPQGNVPKSFPLSSRVELRARSLFSITPPLRERTKIARFTRVRNLLPASALTLNALVIQCPYLRIVRENDHCRSRIDPCTFVSGQQCYSVTSRPSRIRTKHAIKGMTDRMQYLLALEPMKSKDNRVSRQTSAKGERELR